GIPALLDLDRMLEYFCSRHALVGDAADADYPFFEHEVHGIGFEHVGGQLEHFLSRRGCRGRRGVAHVDTRAAARREERPGHDPGVAGNDFDALERPAEPVSEHLRSCCLVALALRRRAYEKVGGAVGIDVDPRWLAGTEAARFDTRGNSDAQEFAIAPLFLLASQLVIADCAQ